MYKVLYDAIDAKKELIYEAENTIQKTPELGFREWKTHSYLKSCFESLGYEVTELEGIPGFYTDVDTGKQGPKIVIFGELDALPCPGHPFADPITGAAHACGHHLQCAMLLGVAIALKAEGALEGMCGSIRLFAVPSEEGVDATYREELKKKGTVRYFAGKVEALYRGLLDDVDIAMMIHSSGTTNAYKFSCNNGSNGNTRKKATFIGRSAHAGGSPQKGLNALYAATNALNAANALRETFVEKDKIRMHPIISKGGNVVNAIPDEVIVENMIRGADLDAIREVSQRVNRAYAGSAAAMGCRVILEDVGGSAPRTNDDNLRDVFYEVACTLLPPEEINFSDGWSAGCTDMGDISCVMPSIHPFVMGCVGSCHSTEFQAVDHELSCVTPAKILAGAAKLLLCENAARAKKVIAEKKVPYPTKEAYFAVKDSMNSVKEGVVYNEDSTITLNF